MEVLLFLKGMFGIPSGAISDMRQGIRATLDEAFPEIPRRICLFHSLRDTGSDLMKSMHIDLGRDINRIGIKSALKEISASMPDYDQTTLYEIEHGFCSDRETMEMMAVKRILERLIGSTGSSGGMGFLSH